MGKNKKSNSHHNYNNYDGYDSSNCFNINNKHGCASKHKIEEFSKNDVHYDSRKQNQIRYANQLLQCDFLKEYGSSDKLDVSKFGNYTFQCKCLQNIPMPFSNKKIDEFIKTDKYAFSKPIRTEYHGKDIYAQFMYGNLNGQNMVYLFEIVKGSQYNENTIDFSIKIDMLVNDKEWFALARLDSIGAGHPNYIVNGRAAKSVSEVEFAQTPHLHINSEEVQVLCCDHNCEYTEAVYVPKLRMLRSSSDDYFKECVDFLSYVLNIKTKINPKIKEDYYFDSYNDLFDPKDVVSSSVVKDVKNQVELNKNQVQFGE